MRPQWLKVNWIANIVIPLLLLPCVFIFRYPTGIGFGDLLWAEDGNIFINQAYEFGFFSIFKTYAGYFHLYPRIWSLMAISLGLKNVPYVLFFGWYLSAHFLYCVLATRLQSIGMERILSLTLPLLIFLQPNSGEVFFTITNAQWFLGAALALMLLGDPVIDFGKFRYGVILVICFTGPFSILVLPIFLLKNRCKAREIIKSDVFWMMFVASCVQLAAILISGRVDQGGADKDVQHWLKSIEVFAVFGGGRDVMYFLSGVFWLLLMLGIFEGVRVNIKKLDYIYIPGLFVGVAVIVFYIAGLFSAKHEPQGLSPLANGARYFFIPYALMIYLLIILTCKNKLTFFISIAVVILISFLQIRPVGRSVSYFEGYAKLAKARGHVYIPISPHWAVYPGWHIQTVEEGIDLPNYSGLPTLMRQNGVVSIDVQGLHLQSNDGDPSVVFKIPACVENSEYVGMVFDTTRMEDGWAQLFWDSGAGFSEGLSYSRFYPKGRLNMEFVFSAKETLHNSVACVLDVSPA